RVAEHLAHHLRVDTRREQQRGGGVAQVVEADLRHRHLLQEEHETAHQIACEERSTKRVAKDEIAVAPGRTNVRSLPFLTLPVAMKYLDHCFAPDGPYCVLRQLCKVVGVEDARQQYQQLRKRRATHDYTTKPGFITFDG